MAFAFDTLGYAKKLRDVGVPQELGAFRKIRLKRTPSRRGSSSWLSWSRATT